MLPTEWSVFPLNEIVVFNYVDFNGVQPLDTGTRLFVWSDE
jgi:hypothetical protein